MKSPHNGVSFVFFCAAFVQINYNILYNMVVVPLYYIQNLTVMCEGHDTYTNPTQRLSQIPASLRMCRKLKNG